MEFKLIVAGSRGFNNYAKLSAAIEQVANGELAHREVSIVSGMARGADLMGHRFAKENGIVVYEFPADWDAFGKRAGFIRNEQMGKFADGLLAFWDGASPGTTNMIHFMQRLNKFTHVIRY